MSATAMKIELDPEISYHREFPDTDIRDHANRLIAIVNAYEASIGGRSGPAYLLHDALTATESLVSRLRERAVSWGIPVSEAWASEG